MTGRSMLTENAQTAAECVGPLWERLHGMHLVITGASGFVGRWMSAVLEAAIDRYGLDVTYTCVASPSSVTTARPTSPSLRWLHHDLAGAAPLRGADLGSSRAVDCIIHLAGIVPGTPRAAEQRSTASVSTNGTPHVLGLAEEVGCRAVLLASSGAVYGDRTATPRPIGEHESGVVDPDSPHAAYAAGKLTMESMGREWASRTGMQIVSARMFTFTGPLLPFDSSYAIAQFIDDALNGRPVHVSGPPNVIRSYLYASDLAVWLWRAVLTTHRLQAVNVGSPHGASIHRIAEMVADIGGTTVIAPNTMPASRPHHYVPDTTLAEEQLGCSVTVPLPDAIARTFAWRRSTTGR